MPRRRRAALVANGLAKIRRLISDFLSLLGVLDLLQRELYDYGVAEFSHLPLPC